MLKIIIASGPVIVRENKVLLNKSGKDNFWKFCGGKVEKNENLKETAIRKAKEEMNIEINIINKKPFLMHVLKLGEERIDVTLVHFLADFIGKIVKGKDVKEWKWIDLDNLPSDIAPSIIPTLKHFKFIDN